MKQLVLCLILFLLTISFISGCLKEDEANTPPKSKSVSTQKGIKRSQKVTTGKKKIVRPHVQAVRGKGDKPQAPTAASIPDLTEEETKTLEKVDQILEREATQDAIAVLNEVTKTAHPQVREAYLKTIGWLGPEMLPEITTFLNDNNADVALEARCQWLDCLYRVENKREKAEIVRFGFQHLTDATMIEEVANELTDVPNVDTFEIAIDGIANGTKAGVEAAKAVYKRITGEPYKDAAQAAKWFSEHSKVRIR